MNAYKQIHLRVFVDHSHPIVSACPIIPEITPKTTRSSGGEEKQSTSTKSGRMSGATGSLALGLNIMGTFTGTLSRTDERSATSEKKRYNDLITENHENGKIRWDYEIDDDHFQEVGNSMPPEILPTVYFKFFDGSKSPPPPPPRIDVVITSYWSKVSWSELKSTRIHKILDLFKSTDNTQTISYSNIFQIVAFTAVVPDLSKETYYPAEAEFYLESGVSEHHKCQLSGAESLTPIENMTPVVVDASGMYIT